jgi:hypothetical protein
VLHVSRKFRGESQSQCSDYCGSLRIDVVRKAKLYLLGTCNVLTFRSVQYDVAVLDLKETAFDLGLLCNDRRRMITTLFWVPRGTAAAAASVPLETASEPDDAASHSSEDCSDGERTSDAAEVGLEQVLTLPDDFWETSDPNLHKHKLDWEQQDIEDERFQQEDWVLFAGRLYEDDSCGFEVCVVERPDVECCAKPLSWEAIDTNIYVHHDGILAAPPLSSAYTDYDGRCLAAVGTFAPTVELWDLVQMNAVEPLMILDTVAAAQTSPSLGHNAAVKQRTRNAQHRLTRDLQRKRKRPSGDRSQGGSTAASASGVLCLGFHPRERWMLAAGSATGHIHFWDIRDGACVVTLPDLHRDKPQALAWHPLQHSLLLTAGFDRRACLVDLRAHSLHSAASGEIQLTRDPEQVLWRSENQCLLSDEGGSISAFDIRRIGKTETALLWSFQACRDRPALMTLAPTVPDMLVVGSTDGHLRVYDLSMLEHCGGVSATEASKAPQWTPLAQVNAHAGALFAVESCPDEVFGFGVACGGSKGILTVVDVAESAPQVLQHFRGRASRSAAEVGARLACIDSLEESGSLDVDK